MKKRLSITVILALLCLLMLCACGESKQPTGDNITPDNTQDNTQNTTPPDTTAGDTTPDTPTPPVQDEPKQPDTPTPPVQDEPKQPDTPTPPVQDDPKQPDPPAPPADPDPQPPVQDDPQPPAEPSVPYEEPIIDYSTAENTTAMQNYYTFLTGEALAYDLLHEKTTSFNDIIRNGEAAIRIFGLVDFGSDGIFEVYMKHEDTRYSNVVLFFENGNLYVDYIPGKGTNAFHIFGIHYANAGSRTGNYLVPTVSAENGLEHRDIAGVYNSTDDTGKVYYINSTYESGLFPAAEKRIVTKAEYEAYVKTIDEMPYMKMFSFTTDNIQQVFLDIK